MLALAHVMDNALVGSNTGVRRGGLTGSDARSSPSASGLAWSWTWRTCRRPGIRDALPLLRPPFVLSHTGFTALAGKQPAAALLPATVKRGAVVWRWCRRFTRLAEPESA